MQSGLAQMTPASLVFVCWPARRLPLRLVADRVAKAQKQQVFMSETDLAQMRFQSPPEGLAARAR